MATAPQPSDDRLGAPPPESAMHGPKALLIDMGFSAVPEPTPIQLNKLTWADAHKSQQDSRASLLLVVGAPKHAVEKFNKYFPGWKFQTVNALSLIHI